MAILYKGDSSYQPDGPPQWFPDGFDIDRLIIPMRGGADSLNTFLATLQPWSRANGYDGNMLLHSWPNDGHKQFPTVNLTYIGKKNGVMPSPRHKYHKAVLTASSKRSSGGLIANEPLVVEYYAPTSTLTSIKRSPAVDSAPDPIDSIQVRTLTVGDTTLALGGTVQQVIAAWFQEGIIESTESEELAPQTIIEGYWRNVSTKTKILTPFILALPAPGTAFLQQASLGIGGWHIGDICYMSNGAGSGSVRVTNIGVSGTILAYTQLACTWHTPQALVPGGRQTRWNVIIA